MTPSLSFSRSIPATALAVLALAAPGCGEDEPFGGELVQSSAQRASVNDVPEAERATAVAGNAAFAFDLYREAGANESGNIFYSPHSISLALAMTWAGARGETEREMTNTLHFTLSPERQHAALNALDLELASRNHASDPKDGKFRLAITNALWGQTGMSFPPAFLNTLAANYGAGMRLLDFIQEPEAARLTINDWVAAKTEDRIQDLLPEGVISSLTRLVLTNAIYFNAAWATPFETADTADGTFTRLDGSAAVVPTMHGLIEGRHGLAKDLQVIELPYQGDKLSMVIIVPDAGRFAEVEAGLAERTASALAALEPAEIQLAMPKFEIEYTLSLQKILSKLGMPTAFSLDADFSGMSEDTPLHIHDVLHKAWVTVNEAGTEAAAATAVVVDTDSAPQYVKVDIDRPFVFFIRDNPTGALLFVGRVVQP